MSISAEEKVTRLRLSQLELAQAQGNASEACRRRGVSRTQFYENKRRFQPNALEGLKDLPPNHHSHPMTTPPEVEERIIELSLQHPAWGCNQLDHWLQLEGIDVSAITIQKMGDRREMGTRCHRWLMLERRHSEKSIELTPKQVQFLEKQNPAFRERPVESSRPEELLCQDTFTIGSIKGIGRIYLHAVVDTYSSLAFGLLYTTKRPEAAAAVLHNDVRPFYQERSIPVSAVLTDNGRECCGTDAHA